MLRQLNTPVGCIGGALLTSALAGTLFQSWPVFWALITILAVAALAVSLRRFTTGHCS